MFLADKTYAFKVSSFSENFEKLDPLFRANFAETGTHRKYDPDFDRFLGLEKSESIMFFIVENREVIVGYALFFIDTDILQRDNVSATQSLNYILSAHRGIGYQFMRFCDDILKRRGVNTICRGATVKRDIGAVYSRLGYTLREKTYRKEL